MRVLHVSLGFPPLRTGGLTRYCTEVMEAQVASGDEVSLVYPGRFGRGKTQVRLGSWHGVTTYEVVNPLPVALTCGVTEPDVFCAPCGDPDAYRWLLDAAQPDVIHVHSFQGVHQEFFEIAKNMGVAMVFTTHDFYLIFLRCTLITSWGESCEMGSSAEACATCNMGAGVTVRRSRVMQSGLYACMKGSALVRAVGARAKSGMSFNEADGDVRQQLSREDVDVYGRLLDYNKGIFELFDLVIANNSMTMGEFQRFFPDASYELLPITHAGLRRNAAPLPAKTEDAPLRIGYCGGKKAYKGYGTMLAAAKLLSDEGFPFELQFYGDDYGDMLTYAHATDRGRLAPNAVRGTWGEHDVVVTLEALCSVVPVICSDVVCTKDLVGKERVFNVGYAGSLAQAIIDFSKSEDHVVTMPDDYLLEMNEQVKLFAEAYVQGSGSLDELIHIVPLSCRAECLSLDYEGRVAA